MMRLGCLLLLVLCFLFHETGRLPAEENPRAIIDRALKAQGGEAKLAQLQHYALKYKGSFAVGDTQIPCTGETFYQSFDQYKEVSLFSGVNENMTRIVVYSGNKAWVGDQMLDMSDDARAEMQKERYVNYVAELIVLKKKGFELSLAGIAKVEDREADVVKVTSPGQPDVRLFFDKATGLLVKTEHRQLDTPELLRQGPKKEILQETFYSDYRSADSVEQDEKTLQAAKMPSDGQGLVRFFQARTKVDADREKVVKLVKQLGDQSFQLREEASQELVVLGAFAVPFLKEALKSDDPEVARRAKRCLQIIEPDEAEKEQQRALLAAAVRILVAQKPVGATEALLAFLPLAGDEVVEREIRAALTALAKRDGKPDPALVKALESKDALCQSAAAEALGKVPLPAGRKIIADGVKRPMKVAVYRDGKLFSKYEFQEVTYFNQLDDKLFAEPRLKNDK